MSHFFLKRDIISRTEWIHVTGVPRFQAASPLKEAAAGPGVPGQQGLFPKLLRVGVGGHGAVVHVQVVHDSHNVDRRGPLCQDDELGLLHRPEDAPEYAPRGPAVNVALLKGLLVQRVDNGPYLGNEEAESGVLEKGGSEESSPDLIAARLTHRK